MKEILLVGTGGFIGAALRYIASTWLSQFTRFGFPLGIFVGLGLGKTTTLPLQEFAVIGILGGFTTFSTFGLESFEMLQAGQFKMTAIYVLGSIVLGISGIGLGILITR
jgi:CrcB protein